MANKTEEIAYKIGDELAKKQGVYLVHAEYKKENKEYFLRLYIDKDGGVGIDDCEKFSRAFSDLIDEADPIEEAYMLEVSSPGAERKLTAPREFTHYIGRDVQVKLYAQLGGKKEFEGKLKGFANDTAEIETEDGVLSIPVKDAVYIRLLFKF